MCIRDRYTGFVFRIWRKYEANPCVPTLFLPGGFQKDLGKISGEIKSLQEQSMSLSIKLRNRKAAETSLGAFVEGITVSPSLVSSLLESEVNEE